MLEFFLLVLNRKPQHVLGGTPRPVEEIWEADFGDFLPCLGLTKVSVICFKNALDRATEEFPSSSRRQFPLFWLQLSAKSKRTWRRSKVPRPNELLSGNPLRLNRRCVKVEVVSFFLGTENKPTMVCTWKRFGASRG